MHQPKPVGRVRAANLREGGERGPLYGLDRLQWRMLPKDFAPFAARTTFMAGAMWGCCASSTTPVMAAREQEGREASLSAWVIGQSVKAIGCGGIRDFHVGKKINGRKRHIVTDTSGLPVGLVVTEPGSGIAAPHRRSSPS